MSPRIAYSLIGLMFVLFVGGAWWHASTKQDSSGAHMSSGTISPMSLTLTSTAFAANGSIPKPYTCDGAQVSPPLSISGAPVGTRSFAIIMDDPDVPKAVKPDGYFLHMVLFNISGDTKEIAEGELHGVFGSNGAGKANYVGPCPPPQYEPSTHRYVFHLFALDTILNLKEGATKEEVLAAMMGHVLEETTLIGRYSRK